MTGACLRYQIAFLYSGRDRVPRYGKQTEEEDISISMCVYGGKEIGMSVTYVGGLGVGREGGREGRG